MKIVSEERWEKVLQELTPDRYTLELISESNHDPYRRVYSDDKYCYKIVLKGEVTGILRVNTLEQEYSILKKCNDISGVPEALKYSKNNNAEVLVMQLLHGKKQMNRNHRPFNVFRKLTKINLQLALKGVSHNDLLETNILVSSAGDVHIVDFDQAVVNGTATAFIRTFFGLKMGGPPIIKSMMGVFLDAMISKLPKTMKMFRNFKRAIFNRNSSKYSEHKLPDLKDDASDSAKLMLAAWEVAQKSNASAPGILYAYYAIEYQGYIYPGERLWTERWNSLREITDYSGRRILELGCNMGLLSSYIMKFEDAQGALAVDRDANIINSAKIVNKALQVDVEHLIVDFDSKETWETKLVEYQPDIVFSLNVLNWVEDKERFLKFLGNFNTLIFEGHEELEIESKRLRNIGFKTISVINRSERNRELLFCEK